MAEDVDGPGAKPDGPGAGADGPGAEVGGPGAGLEVEEESRMGSRVVEQARTWASKGRFTKYSLLQVGHTNFSAHSLRKCEYSELFALNLFPQPLLHSKGKISGLLKVKS